jgi:hypothetical protein
MNGVAAMSKEKTGGETPIEEGARSFSIILQQLGEGTLHSELSETLRDMVRQLEHHAEDFGKAKGTLTLVLTIGADRESGMVAIVPDVKTKLPKPARKTGIFWRNGAGNLVPENPRQQKLPLAAVPQAATRAAPLRDPEDRSVPNT